jgi:hypothetical protein
MFVVNYKDRRTTAAATLSLAAATLAPDLPAGFRDFPALPQRPRPPVSRAAWRAGGSSRAERSLRFAGRLRRRGGRRRDRGGRQLFAGAGTTSRWLGHKGTSRTIPLQLAESSGLGRRQHHVLSRSKGPAPAQGAVGAAQEARRSGQDRRRRGWRSSCRMYRSAEQKRTPSADIMSPNTMPGTTRPQILPWASAINLGATWGILPFDGVRSPSDHSIASHKVYLTYRIRANDWRPKVGIVKRAAEAAVGLEAVTAPSMFEVSFQSLEVRFHGESGAMGSVADLNAGGVTTVLPFMRPAEQLGLSGARLDADLPITGGRLAQRSADMSPRRPYRIRNERWRRCNWRCAGPWMSTATESAPSTATQDSSSPKDP